MATVDERIGYFSSLCDQLYNPSSEQTQVQKILEASFPTFSSDVVTTTTSPANLENVPSFGIQTPTDTANALRILLENSPSPFVQTFCLSRLKQLVLAQFTIFDKDTKLHLRTFLLEYAYIHPDLQSFVIIHLASVLALLTRFGWMEIDEYQNVYKDLTQFIQSSSEHRIVGIQILTIIVQDMNTATVPKYSAKFRKAAAGLRDTQLFDIFQKGIQLLESILSRTLPFDKPDQEERTKDAVLSLLLKCLSYDFAGTTIDEAGDDMGTVQVPAAWRPIFEKEDFLPTFFKAYTEFNATQASKVMECLVQLASTRKALFSTEEERSRFVLAMMQGIREIILTSRGMTDSDCYNGFCRLLQRFRNIATLNEMAEKPGYIEWIQLIANFTQSAFQSYSSTTTCFYLLGFWSRVVQSMTYLQKLDVETGAKLEEIMVQLTRTFISTYIESVPNRVEEMLDDPLDNEDELIESLNMLGQIARCKYEKSCAALIEIFDPITVHYQELIRQASMGVVSDANLKEANDIFEAKFAWMIYTMAVFVGNRPAYLSSDENDDADGQLTTKVIQLMQVNQNLVASNGAFLSEKIDLALVYFFTMFRKAYVGEPNLKAVYARLNEVFSIEGQTDMLNLIMRKIGYSALKTLRKVESTTLIMQNHSSNDFSFFNSHRHSQSRMYYYQVLCKILYADDGCEREFYEFMKPFEAKLDMFRDLRGFIQPIQSRKNYLLFFHWFYPDYMPVLLKGIQAWSPDPSTNVLLKFFGEFVHNKSQRLNLDVSSANGVLIFRDVSQILCTYGQRIVTQHVVEESRKYPVKCLGGKYINFGVFWLYQDKAVSEAYQMMFQLMLNIPMDDMMNFPKLTRSFFTMLDEFASEQMMVDPNMPAEGFLYIMEACEQGVESSDNWIRTHACSTINSIYHYTRLCY
ncbi:armadillo-type protein [Helicostylum pulchrum]|nr:armadillo-type protein [Helicostylum pulchrum]